ncbi:MAG: ATP-binding protein [Hyphomicrobiaceae bacterium]
MSKISELCVAVEPLQPHFKVGDVGDIFLDKNYDRFLSLPVVQDGKPVGIISRSHLQQVFMSRFGRDLQGNKPIEQFMNPAPLVVALDQSMEAASQYVTRNIVFPITEDFIVTNRGEYHGMGSVIDLIRGLERRLVSQNQSLAQAYEKLKESQAQLVQSEKMASLGQMVAGVAHEINTPLGYVQNNFELVRDAYAKWAELNAAYDALFALMQSPGASEVAVNEHFSRLQQLRDEVAAVYPQDGMESLFSDSLYGLQQISEIVVNLKNFSRLDQAAVDNIDVNECVISALTIGNNVIKHKAEVIRDFGVLPRLSCSPSQINQVLLNLVTNAAQAIDNYGRIMIKTLADEQYVHVVVQDNGKGISPENLKKIYDPFFTTKPIGEGTGLGLSIVFGIIKDHGGRIQVKSEVGKGTAFCVSLPIKRVLN